MRLPITPMIIVILINILVDSYIYRLLKHRCRSLLPSRIQLWSAIALAIAIIVTILLPRRNCSNSTLLLIMWLLYGYFAFYIPKYLFVVFDLIAKIPRLFHGHRLRWLTCAGWIVAALTFVTLWWGALITASG